MTTLLPIDESNRKAHIDLHVPVSQKIACNVRLSSRSSLHLYYNTYPDYGSTGTGKQLLIVID